MRIRRLQTQTLLAAFLMLAASVALLGAPSQAAITKEEAIRTASQLTGFDRIEGVVVSAYDEIVLEDDVPFLNIAGRRVWRVQFDNVRITWEWEGKVYENPHIHRFDVLVDKSDGTPLKVLSPLPPGKEPESTLAERRHLLDSRGVRYEGVPRGYPGANLLQVLRSVGAGAAKQIEALYVLYRQIPGSTPEEVASGEVRLQPWQERALPFWVITSRYVPWTPPPLPQGAPVPPSGPYQHIMFQVDASTGQWLTAAHATTDSQPLNGPGPCATIPASAWESAPRPMVLLNPGYGSLPLLGTRQENGSALVPLAAFCDDAGATVAWDDAGQSATATLGEKFITFTLGRGVASVQWSVASPTTNNEQLTTQEIPLRVAPYLNEEGRMMVPLRPLVEALGGTVKWEPEAQIVYVTMPTAVSRQPPEGEPEATDEEAAG